MSASIPLRVPHTTAVAPTETTLDSLTRLELRTCRRVSIQVYNADATQTFAGVVYVKQTGMTAFAIYDDVSFAAVGPLISPRPLVIDTEGVDLIELRGTMSLGGGDVQSGVTKTAP